MHLLRLPHAEALEMASLGDPIHGQPCAEQVYGAAAELDGGHFHKHSPPDCIADSLHHFVRKVDPLSIDSELLPAMTNIELSRPLPHGSSRVATSRRRARRSCRRVNLRSQLEALCER